MIEIVAFARALADTGKHRQARILFGDVVDELEHVDGLADARAAEQTHLAALGEGHQQIDDLDASDQEILAARLLVIGRGRTVNGQVFLGLHRAAVVLRYTEHIHDATERALAYRHLDRRAGGIDRESALQAFGCAHRDGAHHAVAQLLLHFERQFDIGEPQRLVDLRH